MKKNHCNCNGPYTCKVHDGEFVFCSNPKCMCHSSTSMPQPDNVLREFEKEFGKGFISLSIATQDNTKIVGRDNLFNWVKSLLHAKEEEMAKEVEVIKMKAVMRPINIFDDGKIHKMDNYNAGYDKACIDILSTLNPNQETK